MSREIKSCRNSKVFGPDKLSIFHLNHLGPKAIEYITALFILSVTTYSIDLEVFIDHSNTETWKEHLCRNFLLVYLASLPSRESTGVSDSAHYQQMYPTCSRPTRFWTRSLNHLCSAADDNIYRNGIQPEEATRSNYLRSCRFIGCVCHNAP